jgi:hypothetical protein
MEIMECVRLLYVFGKVGMKASDRLIRRIRWVWQRGV